VINFVSNLVGAFCMMFCSIYIWSKLYKTKINFKDYRLYVYVLASILFILVNYFYNIPSVRILVITVILSIINKLIFKNGLKNSVVSTVISQFIICTSDLIFGLIVMFILKIDLSSISVFYGTLFANIFAFIVSIIIVNINIIHKIYFKLISSINNIRHKKVIGFAVLIIVTLNVLLVFIYYNLNIFYIIITNICLIIVYSVVLIKNLETSSMNNLIKSENESLIENLSEFENMLDRQRVDNHENKNQLLIIKNMIKKKDKDVINYIDTIVKDQKEDDEVLYTKVKNIPSGGLQGIIYQKMLVMKDMNILFSLEVSRDIRRIELSNFSMDNNYKLCKILGVFLDNAIEESKNIEDKKIMISLYKDDEFLCVEVSNKYNGIIDMDMLDKEGYTTKGNGHGYGLSLVKKIVSNSDVFINERQISNGFFKQIIKVRL